MNKFHFCICIFNEIISGAASATAVLAMLKHQKESWALVAIHCISQCDLCELVRVPASEHYDILFTLLRPQFRIPLTPSLRSICVRLHPPQSERANENLYSARLDLFIRSAILSNKWTRRQNASWEFIIFIVILIKLANAMANAKPHRRQMIQLEYFLGIFCCWFVCLFVSFDEQAQKRLY